MQADFDQNEGEEQVGSFSIFFAEGESLAKQGEYKKAIESFTKALEFQAEDKSCLVARSRCHLLLGNGAAALQDAEASLKEDKKYHRGLFQKAEALYAMGDFEHALVFYHRGCKIRPELHEFTLGVQKSQEAINNSIGSSKSCKLEKIGDLSFFQQQDVITKKKGTKLLKPRTKASGPAKAKAERKPVASEKTIKELLGELYPDKEYLDKLLKDPGLELQKKDKSIYNTVEEALSYLDQRTEFWRQQKPMYTRKREKELKKYKPKPTRPIGSDPAKHIVKSLEEIDAALANGDAEKSLKQAEQTMKACLASDVPNKAELLATLHSCIGNALLELGDTEKALESHLKDLKLAEERDMLDAQSRALDNLGKVYSILGDYQKATEYWQKKIPLVRSPEEGTWLFHELGCCNLELQCYQEAREYGSQSLQAAEECRDQTWQLNASVLLAQAECKLENLEAALQSFNRSLDLAKALDDEQSQKAIGKAIEDINARLAQPDDATEGKDGEESS